MKQNKEPRDKPTHLQSVNPWPKRQECTVGKRQSLQQLVSGKLNSCMKSEHTFPTYKKQTQKLKNLNIKHDS